VSSVVRGTILGYRKGPNQQYCNQVLLRVDVDSKSLGKLIGARVVTRDAHGNTYRGRVVRILSSKNRTVIAEFKPNIPGQLIGHAVEVTPRGG
jgi:ribosomal protein L35AE/L33A